MKRRSYFMETARLIFGYREAGDQALATALWGDREVTRYISKDGYTPGQIRERWQKERENRDSERLLKKLGFHATGKVFYPPTGLTHPAYRLYKEDYRGSDT